MVTEELDRICCEFAGLEPTERWEVLDAFGVVQAEYCESPSHAEFVRQYRIDRHEPRMPGPGSIRRVLDWPPVSTDWEAVGQLMNAMKTKGYRLDLGVDPDSEPDRCWHCNYAPAWNKIIAYRKYANSGPMALALAVAELVGAGGKE